MARARIDEDGLLLSFEAKGHSGQGRKGLNLPCAAFTVLARTAYSTLRGLPGALVEGRATMPGELDFTVGSMPEAERQKAIGATAFLIEGLSGLAREYPSEVALTVESQRRE